VCKGAGTTTNQNAKVLAWENPQSKKVKVVTIQNWGRQTKKVGAYNSVGACGQQNHFFFFLSNEPTNESNWDQRQSVLNQVV